MKTKKGKLMKRLWDLCVIYIRKRDKMTCQWCGKQVEKSNAHTSHVIPKSHGNILKFDDQNLKLLCYNCHLSRWHKNPLEAYEWFNRKFPDRYEYLMRKKNHIFKLSEAWLEACIEDYEDKIAGLEISGGLR